jgi:hypothetical protein
MRIIDRMPLGEGLSEVWTPDGIAVVKPFQIVVMVSLSIGDILEPGSRRFPAVLDTGLNHNFAIRHEHLDRWTTRMSACIAMSLVQTRPRIFSRSAFGRRKESRSFRRTHLTRLGCRSSASALLSAAT